MSGVAIRTEALTKRYGATVALEGLDLEISRGEVFGYLGPNGPSAPGAAGTRAEGPP